MVKDGSATESEKDVDAVCVPEVPVTVTVDVPAATVLAAVNVNTDCPVLGLGENAAVTPLGSPKTASLTLPVNPYSGLTER